MKMLFNICMSIILKVLCMEYHVIMVVAHGMKNQCLSRIELYVKCYRKLLQKKSLEHMSHGKKHLCAPSVNLAIGLTKRICNLCLNG